MRRKKLKELISVYVAKNPGRAILIGILIFNIIFFTISAFVISTLAPASLREHGFWASIFYTITMILDAGCIQFVVEDIGKTGVILVVVCLLIVLIGMISFTGAVIGYVTNYISGFIESANSGKRKLNISNHTVILNWNSRASEIVNDLLYSEENEKVVILVSERSEEVEKELNNRIEDTLAREEQNLNIKCKEMPFWKKKIYIHKNRLKNNLTIIIREGDTFSSKQLDDISLNQAKTVIILGKDFQSAICKYDYKEKIDKLEKGNTNTIKTLVTVAEITSDENSADDQKIIVEVEDNWTLGLVNKIIEHKERIDKCNIVPVAVNKILGQILAQFSIMPELNLVYSELFSNKGAAFFCKKEKLCTEENTLIREYMEGHLHAIPITNLTTKTGDHTFYVADREESIYKTSNVIPSKSNVLIKKDFWLERRNVVILGHNTKSASIMEGFESFRNEWNFKDGREILNIIVIDNEKSLKKLNYYRDYPYVNKVISADIYDRKIIIDTINEFVDDNEGLDVSVLILSDDAVPTEEMDANALTYLIYVEDLIYKRIEQNKNFDKKTIDVVIEILNPKNTDVVRSYSVDNVVISNRYISKMVTQIGEKESLFELYADILTYDEADCESYESKELYVKKVRRFFETIPSKCTAEELIRSVYESSPEDNKSIVLGYVDADADTENEVILFSGNQSKIEVELSEWDKIILFSNH